MSTVLSSLIANRVRPLLNESTANFWSDAELLAYMNGGIADLFRRIKNQQQDEFFVEDATNVAAAANTRALTGIPTNVSEIRGLRPRVPASYPTLRFFPRKWNDYDFQSADASDALDPSLGGVVFYAPIGQSGPVDDGASPTPAATMTILIAPKLSSAVNLTLAYVPSREEITDSSNVNPVPGESDMALVYYTVAHALGRTPQGNRTTMEPEPGYMKMFEAEALKITVATAPRQTDEPEVAQAFFELEWP